MTTLSDVRDRVRKDLHDTDAGTYRWTDAQLDRHIDRALTELSEAMPQEKTATLATTAGSREVSLAGLDAIGVEAVEYPVGEYPPAYIGFGTWASALFLHVETAPTGANLKLYYRARHVLDGSGSTLSGQQADFVAMGAGGYAALEQAVYTTDHLNTGPNVPGEFRAWGETRLTAFRQLLMQFGRPARVRRRRLYTPA
ncbi:MAG: hypothetical protein U0547_00755 [Dehalococcoidia bacterium]